MKARLPRKTRGGSVSEGTVRRIVSPSPTNSRLPQGQSHTRTPIPSKAPRPRLGAEPAVRRDKVERARELISDLSYPPRKVLQQVAEKLLRKAKFWLLLGFLAL